MLNTTYLRSIRYTNPISPQGDVLYSSHRTSKTPVPTLNPVGVMGVDFMHGTSFWSVCLPPCRVNKFSCVSGDGRPGYDKENPKKNVYELHLTPVNASFRPLKAVLGMAQEWSFNAPGVFSASSEAVDGDFDLWKERCNLPNSTVVSPSSRAYGRVVPKNTSCYLKTAEVTEPQTCVKASTCV